MSRRKTGTREWAEHSVNIARGCQHRCAYCFARAMATRFGRAVDEEDWANIKVDRSKVEKRYPKKAGRIMFPTTHDIVPEIFGECVIVLKKMLNAGNQVLIVSKPHFECILGLLAILSSWKDQVTFRFTIGADDDAILGLWEPGAPPFDERMASLVVAFENGWRTSVSIEPMLDAPNIERLVEKTDPYVNGEIWIGKMNKIACRVVSMEKVEIARIEANQTDDKILKIVEALKGNPKIQWKDSIKEVIKRYGPGN